MLGSQELMTKAMLINRALIQTHPCEIEKKIIYVCVCNYIYVCVFVLLYPLPQSTRNMETGFLQGHVGTEPGEWLQTEKRQV